MPVSWIRHGLPEVLGGKSLQRNEALADWPQVSGSTGGSEMPQPVPSKSPKSIVPISNIPRQKKHTREMIGEKSGKSFQNWWFRIFSYQNSHGYS